MLGQFDVSDTRRSDQCASDLRLCVQVILSSKANGDAQFTELKSRAKSLCEDTDLEKEKKVDVQRTIGDMETQWGKVVQAAEETQRYRLSVAYKMFLLFLLLLVL